MKITSLHCTSLAYGYYYLFVSLRKYFTRATRSGNPRFRTKLRTVLTNISISKLFLRCPTISIALTFPFYLIILIIIRPVYWFIFPLPELFSSLFRRPCLSIMLCIIDRGLLTIREISAKFLRYTLLCTLVIICLSPIVVSARLRPIFQR